LHGAARSAPCREETKKEKPMFTQKRIKMAVGLLAEFLAGVAFVVACNGGRGADAQTACIRWEIVTIRDTDLTPTGQLVGTDPIFAAPDGWEPFMWNPSIGRYVFRRCAQ
jgi:hypothetical protein